MVKNFLKTAYRSFIKNRLYTITNLLGLSVGICCCILIMWFVRSEFSYDKFHSKSDRLYRAWMTKQEKGRDQFVSTITSLPMGPAIQSSVAEIESTCRVYQFSTVVKYNGQGFNESVHMVDTTFLRMFDFALREGNYNGPWTNSNSVIITEALAKKYFQEGQAIGKTIELILGEQTVLFKVSGIVKSSTPESSIKLDILIPFSNDHYLFNEKMRLFAWFNIFTETYVLVKKHASLSTINTSLERIVKKVLGNAYVPGSFAINLQPITSIHLDTSLPKGIEPIGNPKYSYILSTIGIMILLIACINYIILTIGRSASRSLEVGVRKVLGANRQQLVRQFWGESIFLTILSVMIGIILSWILIKPFNQLTSRNIVFQFDVEFTLFCFLLVVVISLITGLYPSIILSRFNVIEVLKGKPKLRNFNSLFPNWLVSAQFVVSITMITCTWIVGQQIHLLKSKDLGYQKEQVVTISTGHLAEEGMRLARLFQSELSKMQGMGPATTVMYGMDEAPWATMGYFDEKQTIRSFQFNAVDEHFLQTMKIELKAGHNFSSINNQYILVNETLVKEYGWQNPIGKKLPGPFNETVIGVMKDFNLESLHSSVKPLVLATNFDSISRKAETMLLKYELKPKVSVRLQQGNIHDQVAALKSVWNRIAPDEEFNISYLDEAITRQYEEDQRIEKAVNWGSALSMFISFMGLFGLVTLTLMNRTKEIAIRKVLGGSVQRIISLIARSFLKLVFISGVISVPLAWYAIHLWLQEFAYRVTISAWIFCWSISLALFITLLIISIQVLKSAIANPVKNIRNE